MADYDEDEREQEDDENTVASLGSAEFMAHRLDVWERARDRLFGVKGNSDIPRPEWGEYSIDPADVLILARFLDGDDINNGD